MLLNTQDCVKGTFQYYFTGFIVCAISQTIFDRISIRSDSISCEVLLEILLSWHLPSVSTEKSAFLIRLWMIERGLLKPFIIWGILKYHDFPVLRLVTIIFLLTQAVKILAVEENLLHCSSKLDGHKTKNL